MSGETSGLELKRRQLEKLLHGSSVVEARENRRYYEFKVRILKKEKVD